MTLLQLSKLPTVKRSTLHSVAQVSKRVEFEHFLFGSLYLSAGVFGHSNPFIEAGVYLAVGTAHLTHTWVKKLKNENGS